MRAVWTCRPHPQASVRRTAPRWPSRRTPAAAATATARPTASSPGASSPCVPASPTLQPCASGCALAVTEAVPRRVDRGGDDQERGHAEDDAQRASTPAAAPHGDGQLLGRAGGLRAGLTEEPDADRLHDRRRR